MSVSIPPELTLQCALDILAVNLNQVLLTLKKNIIASLAAGTFADTARRLFVLGQRNPNGLVKIVSGIQVFKPIISMLNEYASLSPFIIRANIRYVIRYRNAPTLHPDLVDVVSDLQGYFNDWADKVERGTNKGQLASGPAGTR